MNFFSSAGILFDVAIPQQCPAVVISTPTSPPTVCHDSDFCKTTKGNNRHVYREVFIPGLLASFFGQYLQGSPSLVKLITNPDLMPVEMLQLHQNITCGTWPGQLGFIVRLCCVILFCVCVCSFFLQY